MNFDCEMKRVVNVVVEGKRNYENVLVRILSHPGKEAMLISSARSPSFKQSRREEIVE